MYGNGKTNFTELILHLYIYAHNIFNKVKKIN